MDYELESVVDAICEVDGAVLGGGEAVFQGERRRGFGAGVEGDVLEVAIGICHLRIVGLAFCYTSWYSRRDIHVRLFRPCDSDTVWAAHRHISKSVLQVHREVLRRRDRKRRITQGVCV